MKRILLILSIILCLPITALAQSGKINPEQLAPITITVTAGEALTAGAVVSLINSGGTMKAYNNAVGTLKTSPYGTINTPNSANTDYPCAVALDDSRVLMAFIDSDSYPKVIAGTVSGTSITWGTKTILQSVASNYVSACKIDTNKVIICYNSSGIGGSMAVVTVSGTAITKGTPVDFDNRSAFTASHISVDKLDTDKAIVCFRSYSGSAFYGYAKIITVSGTTPTPYPSANTQGTIINDSDIQYTSTVCLTPTLVMVGYNEAASTSYGSVRTLSISGTTITANDELTFNSASTTYISASKISDTKIVVTFVSGGLSVYAKIITVSGTTLTSGDGNLVYNSNTPYYSFCKALDSTHVFVVYNINSTSAESKIGTTSGSAITFSTASTLLNGNALKMSVSALSNNKLAIVFRDNSDLNYGKAVINIPFENSYASVCGISQGAYSAGSNATILLRGYDNNQSGLIAGSPYYLQSDFTIGTTPIALTKSIYTAQGTSKEVLIGKAKSSTKLQLDIDYK